MAKWVFLFYFIFSYKHLGGWDGFALQIMAAAMRRYDKKSCFWEGSNQVKAQLVWMVQRKQRLWTKNACLITICCSGSVTGSVSSSSSYVLGFQKAATWRDSVFTFIHTFSGNICLSTKKMFAMKIHFCRQEQYQ